MASVRALRMAQEKRTKKHANSSSASLPPPPPPPARSSPCCENAPGEDGGSNVELVLFKTLVDMVPLVESLVDRRPNPSFRRRASMAYTPTPSQPQKAVDQNGRMTAQTRSSKKQSNCGESVPIEESDKLDGSSGFSKFSPKTLTAEDLQKNKEELQALQEQFGGLQQSFLEKDEALKALKDTMNEMNAVNATLQELKQQVVEKDSLITNANVQLANTKVKLEERHSALEKVELEVTELNSKIEELQGVLNSTNFEISAYMRFFGELSKTYPNESPEDNDAFLEDNIDEDDMQKMEEARIAYVAAVAAAKANPGKESLAAAAEARLHLQALLLNSH